MNDETRPLIDLLRNAAARRGAPLNPAWLANAALLELDPHGQAPALMRAACLMQLRELAEGLLGSARQPGTETRSGSGFRPRPPPRSLADWQEGV